MKLKNFEEVKENYKNLSNERLEGESYEDYKLRLKLQQSAIKRYKKGKLIHKSRTYTEQMLGIKGNTYVKENS